MIGHHLSGVYMICSFDEGKAATVSAGGRDFEVTPELLDIKLEEQKLSGRCASQSTSWATICYYGVRISCLKSCCQYFLPDSPPQGVVIRLASRFF